MKEEQIESLAAHMKIIKKTVFYMRMNTHVIDKEDYRRKLTVLEKSIKNIEAILSNENVFID